jgi:hypothetical protein
LILGGKEMTRTNRHVIVVLALLLVAATSLSQSAASPSREAPPIGSGTVLFDDSQVTANRFAVRAFIPTGSLSQHCLATLSESNFAIPGISVFCAPREFQGQQGILFGAFFPQPVPPGLILSATIYQEHAHGYGAPAFYCTTDPNC